MKKREAVETLSSDGGERKKRKAEFEE